MIAGLLAVAGARAAGGLPLDEIRLKTADWVALVHELALLWRYAPVHSLDPNTAELAGSVTFHTAGGPLLIAHEEG